MKQAAPFVLNLVLLAFVIYLLKTRPAISTAKNASPTIEKKIGSVEKSSSNNFHWRQVESEDYRTYIANLRSVGCPEETIRDIIIADVNKLYGARRSELIGGGRSKFWWQTSEPLTTRAQVERERQLKELDSEKRDLIVQLLGIDIDQELQKYALAENESSERLSFLPPGKREKVKSLLEKYHREHDALFNETEDPSAPPDWKKLKQLRDEREAELARLLSSAELQEYQLRNNETAENLRRSLVGFHPGAEEFREIFGLLKEHDDKFAFMDPSDAAAHQQKRGELNQINEQLKNILGEQRYGEYDRSMSDEFQNLFRLTRQYDLPEESATKIFEKNKLLRERSEQVQSDASLSSDQKETALRGYQEELEHTIKDALGERAFRYYKRWGNNHWLQNN